MLKSGIAQLPFPATCWSIIGAARLTPFHKHTESKAAGADAMSAVVDPGTRLRAGTTLTACDIVGKHGGQRISYEELP
jgi:hypothetical protein